MSDRYFVDTNILMYAHDNAAGEKHERAKTLVEELWRERTGVVSTQVFRNSPSICVGKPVGRSTPRRRVRSSLTT